MILPGKSCTSFECSSRVHFQAIVVSVLESTAAIATSTCATSTPSPTHMSGIPKWLISYPELPGVRYLFCDSMLHMIMRVTHIRNAALSLSIPSWARMKLLQCSIQMPGDGAIASDQVHIHVSPSTTRCSKPISRIPRTGQREASIENSQEGLIYILCRRALQSWPRYRNNVCCQYIDTRRVRNRDQHCRVLHCWKNLHP